MQKFRNLLNKEEFIQKNELFKEYKLNEADGGAFNMSNRTGWSESLIGRGVNKLFSGFKKMTDTIVLNQLKGKLENEYLKGVLRAMSQKGIKVEDIESVDLTIDVFMIKSDEKETKIENQNKIEPYKYNNNIFFFNYEGNLEDYIYEIIPHNENVNVVVEYTENVSDNNKKSDETLSVKVSGDGKEIKYLIAAISEKITQDTQTQTQTQTTQETDKSKELPSAEVNKNKELPSAQVNKNKELPSAQVNKNDSTNNKGELTKYVPKPGEVVVVKTKGDENLQNIKNYPEATIKDVKNDTVVVEIDGESKEVNKSSVLPKFTKTYWDKIVARKKEGYEILNKLKCNISNPNICKRSKMMLDKFLVYSRSEEEIETAWNKFKEMVKKMDSSVEFVNESKFNKFVYDKYVKEFENYVNSFFVFEKLDIKNRYIIKKLNKEQRNALNLGKTQNINNIIKVNGIKDKDRNMMKAYGKLDISKLDSTSVAKKFIEDAQLRKSATSLVDKEALKEIALRAQWIYDQDKYKDRRSEVYSRVNWTVTGPDMAKLENTWKKKISKAKSEYMQFFNDDTGNFPQSLDPIALINSDKKFRDKWEQYSGKETFTNSNIGGGVENIQTSNSEQEKIGIVSEKGINDFGIFNIKPTDGTNLGMLVQKIVYKKHLIAYKFLGMVDYNKLLVDIKDIKKEEKDKLKEAIISNCYFGKDDNNKFPDSIKENYKIFRKAGGHLSGDEYKLSSKDRPTIFFRSRTVNSQSTAKFVQTTTIIPQNKFYLSVVEGRRKIVKLDQSYQEGDNYEFYLDIQEVISINDYSLWENSTLSFDKSKEQHINDSVKQIMKLDVENNDIEKATNSIK